MSQIQLANPNTKPGWTPLSVLLMLTFAALGVAFTWRGWSDLAWLAYHDEESSHVMLVPLIIGYLLWQRWEVVLDSPPRFGWIGPVVLAAGVFMWEYGYRYDYRVGDHIGAVMILAGTVLCVTGDRFFYRLWPVFLLLGFLIPVPYTVRVALAVPLQRLNASITYDLLSVAGIPLQRFGSVLELNGQRIGVAEACNGMRSILAVLLVCYASAFATRVRPSARLLLLLVAPFIALGANIIRLMLTTIAYGYWSIGLADTAHDMLGWLTIAIAFGFVLGAVQLARWLMIPIDMPEPPSPRPAATTTAQLA